MPWLIYPNAAGDHRFPLLLQVRSDNKICKWYESLSAIYLRVKPSDFLAWPMGQRERAPCLWVLGKNPGHCTAQHERGSLRTVLDNIYPLRRGVIKAKVIGS